MALPAALGALIVISLFVASSAFFTLQETRASRAAWTERSALEASEYGVSAVMRDWDPSRIESTAVGATLGPYVTALSQGASASAMLTRLSTTTFWVVSAGTAGFASRRAEARRVVQGMLRLDLATPVIDAALTVRDSAEVLSGGIVSGTDTTLTTSAAFPSCATSGAPSAGVAAPDTTHVCDGTCGTSAGNIRGVPPMVSDPLAGDSMRYLRFGGQSRQSLIARADVVLPPNANITPGPLVVAGACQRGATTNWGDPSGAGACRSFFPVIWAPSDLTITGGAGQGILIADGDVRLASGAQFDGLIVAHGDIVTLSGGGTVFGAALAGNATGRAGHTIIGAGARIQFSRCALERALFGSAPLRRVAQRWWSEFY